MYEKACSAATVLFFALCMLLTAHAMYSGTLTTTFALRWNACSLLLCGGCLALMALRRPTLPRRACLGALWFQSFCLTPHPFALDGPDTDHLAECLPPLFLGSCVVAAFYSLLYCLAAAQRRDRIAATEETPSSSLNRPLTLQDALAGLVAFIVGFASFSNLIDLARLVTSAQP